MEKRIRQILDSGNWVEMEYWMYEERNDIKPKRINITIKYISDRGIVYAEDSMGLVEGDYFQNNIGDGKIMKVKPAGRPLHKYKPGDLVVILDNYEGDRFGIGEEYEVQGMAWGNVNLSTDGTIDKTFPVDVRCVAPVKKPEANKEDSIIRKKELDEYIRKHGMIGKAIAEILLYGFSFGVIVWIIFQLHGLNEDRKAPTGYYKEVKCECVLD